MLYPDLYEHSIEPRNKLEQDLYSCDASADAAVVALVSKMFAVSAEDLPENKKKPASVEELRAKVKAAREARKAAEDAGGSANGVVSKPLEEALDQMKIEDGQSDHMPRREILLGFARIYSGTIRVGTSIACILPKYNHAYGPTHGRNQRHIVTAEVEALYVMMGRELVSVQSVQAGNVFAIRGLEGKVWRNATLCAPDGRGIDVAAGLAQLTESIVNLGGTSRIVRLVSVPMLSCLTVRRRLPLLYE